MNPLFIILFRILQGDRLRKPTPEEERFWAGYFFIIPLYFGAAVLSMRYARHFWDTAGEFQLVVAAAAVISVLFFGTRFWGRHVSAKISWTLGAIEWPVILFLALTGRLV
jgi:hypothetical protein